MTQVTEVNRNSRKYVLTSFGKLQFALASESTVTDVDWAVLREGVSNCLVIRKAYSLHDLHDHACSDQFLAPWDGKSLTCSKEELCLLHAIHLCPMNRNPLLGRGCTS
jgi:hypothetical protein